MTAGAFPPMLRMGEAASLVVWMTNVEVDTRCGGIRPLNAMAEPRIGWFAKCSGHIRSGIVDWLCEKRTGRVVPWTSGDVGPKASSAAKGWPMDRGGTAGGARVGGGGVSIRRSGGCSHCGSGWPGLLLGCYERRFVRNDHARDRGPNGRSLPNPGCSRGCAESACAAQQ